MRAAGAAQPWRHGRTAGRQGGRTRRVRRVRRVLVAQLVWVPCHATLGRRVDALMPSTHQGSAPHAEPTAGTQPAGRLDPPARRGTGRVPRPRDPAARQPWFHVGLEFQNLAWHAGMCPSQAPCTEPCSGACVHVQQHTWMKAYAPSSCACTSPSTSAGPAPSSPKNTHCTRGDAEMREITV